MSTARHPTVPSGQVISQQPAAGTLVLQGSAVDLLLSLGAPGPEDLASILLQPVNPLILATQSQPFAAIGILGNGSSRSLAGQITWASSNLAIATIDSTGVATGVAAGTVTISATAEGLTGAMLLTVSAPEPGDTTLPNAAITSPTHDATVISPTAVVGTASDANFFKYVLDIAPVGETTFTPIAIGTAPVSNDVLGHLDPTLLLNDLYTLRLTVVDRANNTTETSIQVQVAREQKVGNFTLAFQDLTVPVAGLPITVVRTYDSRDKGRGDFGIGWRLDVHTLRLRVNREQGSAWRVDRSGLLTYTLVPTDTHKVSITLPDGKVEEFDFTPTPSSQQGPLLALTAAYTSRSLTRGTLLPLGELSLVILDGQPGPVDLLLESDLSIYDPQAFEYTTPEGQRISSSIAAPGCRACAISTAIP